MKASDIIDNIFEGGARSLARSFHSLATINKFADSLDGLHAWDEDEQCHVFPNGMQAWNSM